MRKLKLTVQYDGTEFAGFQRQPGRRTVQEVLEETFARCLGHEVTVVAASRTDAGVHALGQVVCIETGVPIPTERVPRAFTAALPSSVAVVAAEEVPLSFHPRFDALWKRYVYRIVMRDIRSPFLGRYAWCVRERLCVEAMAEAGSYLRGRHDFRSFCAAGEDRDDFVRDVKRLELAQDGDIVELWIEADGFLYRMVRIIAGTLVEVGKGRMEPEQIADVIAARDRRRAGRTAPPHGLCLAKVGY